MYNNGPCKNKIGNNPILKYSTVSNGSNFAPSDTEITPSQKAIIVKLICLGLFVTNIKIPKIACTNPINAIVLTINAILPNFLSDK